MDPGFAVLISALFATVGWLYNGRIQRIMNRRQHTYQIIIRQQDDEEVKSALKVLRKVLRAGAPPRQGDPLSGDTMETLDFLLNRYEFIAAAVWCGDIDEK